MVNNLLKVELMFSCPYLNEQDYRMPPPAPINYSYIRVLHAAPETPNVDVYANGRIIARNLAYRNFTQYIKLPAGSYNIKVFPAGTTAKPAIEESLEFPVRSIYTIAAIGLPGSLDLLPILEPLTSITPGTTMLRVAHLSPNAPSVDIPLPNGQKLFKDVEYKEVTGYIPLRPGTYTLQARLTGTQNVVLNVPNIRLLPNRLYTVYIIGLVGRKPPLQVLIPMDGSSYLKFRLEEEL